MAGFILLAILCRYPCYPKQIYTLDPSAPIHAARREMHVSKSTTSLPDRAEDTRMTSAKSTTKSTARTGSIKKLPVSPKDYTNSKLKPVVPVMLETVDGSHKYFYGRHSARLSPGRPLTSNELLSHTTSSLRGIENQGFTESPSMITSVSIPRPNVLEIDTDNDSVCSLKVDAEDSKDVSCDVCGAHVTCLLL